MSDKTTFKKKPCDICSQEISVGGAAYTSHMRAHVRKGEAEEFQQGQHLKFIPKKELETYIEQHPYAKLGEDPLPGQPKGVWQLPDIKVDIPAIDPASYFITSGEAVKKADKLVKDCYSTAVKARAFRDSLVKSRGTKKYLETARENGRLLVKVKEPRQKGDKDEEESDE
jgi:hypothetical protein